jgi:hypothetical protein
MMRCTQGWWFTLIALVCCWSSVCTAQSFGEREEILRFGEDIVVTAADVLDEAVAIGGSVTVLTGGRVTHNVMAIGGDVILQTGAQIDGDVTVIGGALRKEAGVWIGGKEMVMASWLREDVDTVHRWGPVGFLYRLYITGVVLHLGVVLLLAATGAVLILLMPESVQTIATTLQRDTLKSGVWGVGGLVLGFLLLGLTAGSLLGLLLVPPLLLVFSFIGVLGSCASAVFVGERTTGESQRSLFRRFLLGMGVLGLCGLLPVIGKVICMLLWLFGCGAVLMSRGGQQSMVSQS